MRFYLNGVLVGYNDYEGSFAAIGHGEHSYLGKSTWKENAYFRGQLDEVRVWSVARREEQIRAGSGSAATASTVFSGSREPTGVRFLNAVFNF